MANIKFSAFTNQAAADTTYLVGYDGTDNTNYTKAQIKTWLTTGNNAIPTLYSADGTLASARTITMDGNTLSMAQASGNTVTFSSLNNEGISIAGGFNYKIDTGSGAFTIDSSTSSNSNAIVLQTNNGAGTNASILIDSRSPGANADLHLKTATKLKIDLPVAATVGYVLKADDTAGNVSWGAQTDTTYNVFTGADGSSGGSTGLVPQPAAADNVKFLTGAATWATPTDTTYSTFTYNSGAPANSTSGLVPAPTTSGDNTKFLRGDATWVVPTDTTYTGGTDVTISGSAINHDSITNNVTTDGSTLSFGGTFDAIDSVTVSAQGHITAQNTKTYTLPSAQNLPTSANPSATISGTVANGSATTFMRSDAVPALGSTITIGTAGTTRGIVSIEGGGGADAQLKLHCSSGSPQHAITIEGPQHSGGSNYIIKLPHGAPALNKILKVGTYAANAGSYADPSLATMIWADDTDTSIYAANGSLTGARSVTMGTHNLTFASTTAGQEVKFQQNVRIDGQSYTPLETISSTNSWTPDWDSGNVQTMELNAATTINNPSNIEIGATYIMILKQDSTGSRTVTWGNAYNFSANTPPTLTTGANKADVITLVAYSSTVLMCTSVLDFQTS